MTSKLLDSGFHNAGGRSAILPTSLTMPLAYTNTSQIGKYLKRRSMSLSSESSSFSLPFKKRRFVLIAANEDDDDFEQARNTTNGAATSTPSFGLSPIHADSSGETKVLQRQQQQQRDTMVATPTQSIDGKGSSTTTATPLIACITPVPGTPKFGKHQEVVVNIYSKELSSASTPPALLVCKPAQDETETVMNDKSTTTSLSFNASPLPMQTRSRRNSNVSASSASSSSCSNSNNKRLSHPKLNAPLPNGCHGQTSRTQSFCRRGPNYNGSNYCKLHYFDPRYQSLIQEQAQERTKCSNVTIKMESEASTDRTTKDPTTESIDTNKNQPSGTKPLESKQEETKEHTESIPSSSSSRTTTSTTKPNKKRAPRDKLYRGLSNNNDDGGTSVEVRCLAISTRGKRCCYAAVACNGNQYCHRHSSFFVASSGTDDTAASTIRSNGDKDTKQTEKSNEDTSVVEATIPPSNQSKVEAFSETTTSPSSSVRRRSCATFRREASETARAAEFETGTEAPEPRPPTALSDLSTDLWQNRKVLVSKGPHKSKVGTVVRWRNGWVTVELAVQEEREQTVCHNRRSYELFLV